MVNLKALLVSAFLLNSFVQAASNPIPQDLYDCISKQTWKTERICTSQISTEVYNQLIRWQNPNFPVTTHTENKKLGIVEYNCKLTSYKRVSNVEYTAYLTCKASEMVKPFLEHTSSTVYRSCTSFPEHVRFKTGRVSGGTIWLKWKMCYNGKETWKTLSGI